MARPQPDFTALFYESLGGQPEPIRYKLREGPCLLHDIAFLNSLIHDARVMNPGVDVANGTLSLHVNRDCWEYGYTRKHDALELHIANASIDIAGVVSSRWIFAGTPVVEPWIDFLWFCRSYLSHRTTNFEAILAGEHWECRLVLDREAWSLELRDEETPHLFGRH